MSSTCLRPTYFATFAFLALACFGNIYVVSGNDTGVPEGAKPWKQLSNENLSVSIRDNTIWLQLGANAVKDQKAVIPRLAAPIRSIRWIGDQDAELKFWPEPDEWIFSWKEAHKGAAVIEVVFDRVPVLPADCPAAVPAGDSSIMLQAYQASTFGEKLRFEPQWF